MRCPDCDSILLQTDDGQMLCLDCGKEFCRAIPTETDETPPESPQDGTEREELETLII